jgi:cation diffusion facilitator CzcD-associated flavoprotein CzcO
MYTLGYAFRPWPSAKAIADGPAILSYVKDTASENGIDRHIRFNHRAVRAEWSSAEQRWTVEVERTDTGETTRLTCDFLFMCSGYYRYDEGYTPEFEGTDRFRGQIIHPQFWSDDIDHAGKRVVVIGSGATAVTLVPAMAPDAEHVTMLQRSPSYVISLPGIDPIARVLRRFLPKRLAYSIIRWKNVLMTMGSFQLSRRRPELAKKLIRKFVKQQLPPGYDVNKHFTPTYNPWDQRLCLVPDGDLFAAIGNGSASVVTDRIATFTEEGLELESGETLEADLIVTATGLNLLAFGGLEISVDGEDVSLPEKLAYKGMMLDEVPNFAAALGYTNASWTLKCDLTCAYVCRLLNHMDEQGYTHCVPAKPAQSVEAQPFIDFNSGYVVRSIDNFPRQGSRAPWRLYQNYAKDIMALRYGSLDDEAMRFGNGAVTRERVAARAS